ncbi:MAG: hypothetical protein ACRDNF_10435, partial [Streptosporangiaceae bacterium]
MVNARLLPSGRAAARIAAATGAALLFASTATGTAVAQSAAGAAQAVQAGHSARSANSSTTWWEGTDSWPITISGSAPYHEPAIGGDYGGYIGMT